VRRKKIADLRIFLALLKNRLKNADYCKISTYLPHTFTWYKIRPVGRNCLIGKKFNSLVYWYASSLEVCLF
jgi:hypothetical protein